MGVKKKKFLLTSLSGGGGGGGGEEWEPLYVHLPLHSLSAQSLAPPV